jgi:hypothetical protein
LFSIDCSVALRAGCCMNAIVSNFQAD